MLKFSRAEPEVIRRCAVWPDPNSIQSIPNLLCPFRAVKWQGQKLLWVAI